MTLDELTFFNYHPIWRTGLGSGYAIQGSYTVPTGNFETYELGWTPSEEVAKFIAEALNRKNKRRSSNI